MFLRVYIVHYLSTGMIMCKSTSISLKTYLQHIFVSPIDLDF